MDARSAFPKKKYNGLTEYEKMVQSNKEETIAFLESLKINEIKESFSEAVRHMTTKPKPLKTAKRPRSPVVSRKSLRLSKIDLNLSEENIEYRLRAELDAVLENQRKKFPPKLPFIDVLQGDDRHEKFNKDFNEMKSSIQNKGDIKPFLKHASHFEKMKKMTMAKIYCGHISTLALHPMQLLVSAGSDNGKIGFWNVNSDSNPYVFEPHSKAITHLKFNPEKPHLVVSSSYDGTVRCGDIVQSVFNEVYNVSPQTRCTYFDFLTPSTLLVAREDGNVSVVDSRGEIKLHRCHVHSVKSLSVHPLDKNYFISAERKGAIALWDLRKLQRQPVVEVQHHKRCVQSAYFSPRTGKSVLTLSSDETICIFDSSNLGKSVTFKQSMRHYNRPGPFPANWLPNTDDTFVVGSVSRRIEIYNDKMENIFNFTDEHLGCTTSLNCFHPSMPVLAGTNSTNYGKVYVFTDPST